MRAASFVIVAVGAGSAFAAPSEATLSALADKPEQIGNVIDPKLGLVLVDHFPTPDGAYPRELHLCKPSEIGKLWKDEIAPAIKNARTNQVIACDADACRVGGAGEWDPVLHLRFDHGRLRSIAIDDEVLVGQQTIDDEHAAEAKVIAKLSTKC